MSSFVSVPPYSCIFFLFLTYSFPVLVCSIVESQSIWFYWILFVIIDPNSYPYQILFIRFFTLFTSATLLEIWAHSQRGLGVWNCPYICLLYTSFYCLQKNYTVKNTAVGHMRQQLPTLISDANLITALIVRVSFVSWA